MPVNVELTTKLNSTAFFQFGSGNGSAGDPYIPTLPFGAATATKQPALGIAGTASSDVLTIQGINNMFPLANNISQVNGVPHSATNGLYIRPGNSTTFNSNLSQVNGNPVSITNPIITQLSNGANLLSVTNPLATQLSNGGSIISLTNPLAAQLSVGGIAVGPSNGLSIQPATASIFNTNMTQFAGAAISATNAPFVRLTNGTAAISTANPVPTSFGKLPDTLQSITLTTGGSVIYTLDGYSNFVVQIALIGVVTNANFRVRGSIDGTNYGLLLDTTSTVSEVFIHSYTNIAYTHIRIALGSSVGGTPSLGVSILRY